MGNLDMLCTCGQGVHVGSVVRAVAGVAGPLVAGGEVTAVVTTVRRVDAQPARSDVWPNLEGQAAMLVLTVLVTSAQSYPAPTQGEYVTLAGVTPTAVGCCNA